MSEDHLPQDHAARQRALDPLGSFCVSAPAGSGKTGLLVKRYLALLARCDDPERVVAITFTRKAAAEMRSRVIEALSDAAANRPAQSAHERELRTLAMGALERDLSLNWGIRRNSHRLAIRTIDSFCSELSRQMPVQSGCGGQLRTIDDARPLYREAAERFLKAGLRSSDEGRRRDVETLLLHLDNQWETTLDLLAQLLSRRDQWLPRLGVSSVGDHEEASLQMSIQALVAYRLERARLHLKPYLQTLQTVLGQRDQLQGAGKALDFDPTQDDVARWQAMTGLLLTQGGDWRKTVDKRSGFPVDSDAARELKNEMVELLTRLREEGGEVLCTELRRLLTLPEPGADGGHWNVLASLTRALPRLAAQLLLVFRQHGEADHAQIALAALTALGEDEAPTDLALQLDHRIEHLLVDEFQDTSTLQFELVRRVTRGWAEHNDSNPDAPRTLFLVGDAMQSIYGFREANVGLFIQARGTGVGDLSLQPLDLTVNFRSTGALVQWCNQQFSAAFPVEDDSQLGAAAFRSADAARALEQPPEIRLFTGDGGEEAEVDALCSRLLPALEDPGVTSIAILGRTRNHLQPVLRGLRERGIPFAGQDLDPLGSRPLIQDLRTLYGVLADPLDRFSWLCLLRCPSVGLGHEDLLLISRHFGSGDSFRRSGPGELEGLSASAQDRLQWLHEWFLWVEHYRDRLAVRVWVEQSWIRFGGDASLAGESDRADAESFFQLLEELAQEGEGLALTVLDDALQSLYSAPANRGSKLQVMTLHKAKGLEFDQVYLPALTRSSGGQERDLLLWDEYVLPDTGAAFLLDVRSAVGAKDTGRLYDFLYAQAKEKRRLELTRLFYVGCTRAADYLWLSGTLPWNDRQEAPSAPGSASLLSDLWPALENSYVPQYHEPTDAATHKKAGYRRLMQVPDIEAPTGTPASSLQLPVQNLTARAYGTAVHRALESLVYRAELPDQCDDALLTLVQITLGDEGVDEASHNELCSRALVDLNRTLNDPWARWMLDRNRPDRHAELAVGLTDDEGVRDLVLDYVFVDEKKNERWVVDYKTAVPLPGQARADFLAEQSSHYGEQLSAYRRALQSLYPEPVRCALYFTALGLSHEWCGP